MADLHDLSALDAAAAIRRREVSSSELVDHYLDRIQRLDGQVGAFVTVTDTAAREQARQADAQVLAGVALPPLLQL
jgi:amidase